jgi:hypothetical protein
MGITYPQAGAVLNVFFALFTDLHHCSVSVINAKTIACFKPVIVETQGVSARQMLS